jgi:proteasome lid subunit RPN8/RPN11
MLRFSPTAWAKLLFLRDVGDTEVGGFGISSPHDLLLIQEFVLIPQACCPVSVSFADEAVAEYFDQQIDLGRRPEEFARIWVHTHPGHCAQPSSVDEATFARVFGRSDWAVMAIVACGGETTARLQFRAGPGDSIGLPVDVDYTAPFAESDHEAWTNEYLAAVHPIADLFDAEDKCFPNMSLVDAWPDLVTPDAELRGARSHDRHGR